MARKLFGTDGVRGVAGELLTAELALALGRAAVEQVAGGAPAGADHPRHARVGRDARGGARRRRHRRRGRRAARRRAADAGRAAADRAATASTSRRSSRASHNPYHDNGIKFFGARRLQARPTRPRRRSRSAWTRAAAPPARDRARRATLRGDARGLPARAADALRRPRPGRRRRAAGLRQRRDLPRRAGDLPAARRDGDVDRRRARRAQHQRRLRLDARRGARPARCARRRTTSASPSTATATACWPSTATARSSTATS